MRMKNSLLFRLAEALNVLLITAPFVYCWYAYYAERLYSPFFRRGNWAVIALFALIYVTYIKVYDAYAVSTSRIAELVYSQALSVLFTDAILYVITYLLMKGIPNPVPLLTALLVQVALAVVWCVAAHRAYFAIFPPIRCAVIYDRRPELEHLIERYRMEKKFNIVLTQDIDACLADIGMLDGMEAVFLGGIHSHERNILLKYCMEKEIDVYVIPRIGDTIMSGAKQTHMFHLPILHVSWFHQTAEYQVVKRLMDIVVSAAALVVTSPVMLLTAVMIRLEDGGTVFYRQTRLTRGGRQFELLKFRSMRMDAEKDGKARLSGGEGDDRITRVGRFIRRHRIDELPQFLNILRGEMTLVGPRPERPEIAARYTEEIPEFALRLKAKAGLTGYAQVYGKYNTEPYDKLQMDLMYLAHPGIVEDMRILFLTVRVLFQKESTEGVSPEREEAKGIGVVRGSRATRN